MPDRCLGSEMQNQLITEPIKEVAANIASTHLNCKWLGKMGKEANSILGISALGFKAE